MRLKAEEAALIADADAPLRRRGGGGGGSASFP